MLPFMCSRKAGKVEWVTGVFFLLFLMIMFCVQLELLLYQSASDYLEDALAASNLASAVIDPEVYGINHTLRISDPRQAYMTYLGAVKTNLRLDDQMNCSETGVISGPVKIMNYTIYNVEGENVKIWFVDEYGSSHERTAGYGSVSAPDGQMIENTSVYSEISFPVKGLFGMEVMAHKGKLVDILSANEDG